MRLMRFRDTDDPRRRLLIQALALGLFSIVPASRAFAADIFGRKPSRLPGGQSVYRLVGGATVNGKQASMQTLIRPGDTVETGKGAELVFAVGESAFILRESSRVTLESTDKSSLLITALRLLTGKLLSVFPPKGKPVQAFTLTSTIGIRGTGFYMETDPEQTYFCTCYGVTEIAAINDPKSTTTVAAFQHDRPLYILAKAPPGESIREAPFINHTDQELQIIEALVGRVPPFVYPKEDYRAPRRDY